MTPTDLLAKLEEAECGSRELDIDIAYAVDRIPKTWLRDFLPGGLPDYTRSVDAALTLVPEGWSWSVGEFPKVRAQLAEPIMTRFGPGIGMRQDAKAKTVEIALVIAALRARK